MAGTQTAPGDLGFSYELGIDIDFNYGTANDGTDDWRNVAFITNADPTNSKTMGDAATYADRGGTRSAITGDDWGLSFDHQVQRKSDGTYIDVLQKLVDVSRYGLRNKAAKVRVRVYDTEGADYAYIGTAYVQMARGPKGNSDIGSLTFTLTGDGKQTKIANPVVAEDVDTTPPTVTAATPATATTGSTLTLTGTGFSRTISSVKLGDVQATDWNVLSATSMTVKVPAGSAGSAPIVVTGQDGASTAFAYTRGA